jgi:hypothetical protein
VALVALTVNMDEAPAAMEAGLTAMVTVGSVAGGSVGNVPDLAAPHPASITRTAKSEIAARGEDSL